VAFWTRINFTALKPIPDYPTHAIDDGLKPTQFFVIKIWEDLADFSSLKLHFLILKNPYYLQVTAIIGIVDKKLFCPATEPGLNPFFGERGTGQSCYQEFYSSLLSGMQKMEKFAKLTKYMVSPIVFFYIKKHHESKSYCSFLSLLACTYWDLTLCSEDNLFLFSVPHAPSQRLEGMGGGGVASCPPPVFIHKDLVTYVSQAKVYKNRNLSS